MPIFDLYAVNTENLEDAKARVERALLISFEERESTYQGGKYFLFGNEAHEHFVLKRNIDPFDGEPVEMTFPRSGVLLYVNDTPRSTELQDALAKEGDIFRLLRHEDL